MDRSPSTVASFASRVRSVLRLADAPRWATPAIVGLGVISALFEGAGLYLFIPLVEILGAQGASGSAVGALFARLLAPVPESWRVGVLIAGLCASILLKNCVGQLNNYVTQYVNGLVAHRLRVRVLRQTIDSCVDYRVENRRSDIVNTIASNTWSVGTALAKLDRMIVCACAIGVFVVLLLLVSPALTAIAIACLGLIALTVAFATRNAHRVGQQVVAENKAFGMRMWESILGLRLIRSCAREEHEMERFAAASDSVRRKIMHMTMLWSVPAPVAEVCGTVVIATLILAGTRLGVGVAALAAFLALLYRMQGPVRELMSLRVGFEGSFAAVQDVAEFLERTREPYLVDGTTPFQRLQRGIELRAVSYQYEAEERPALQHLSLFIPKGKTTAIVGRSGAGKSTLMSLLFRFRDPTAGTILVDGTPLTQLQIASWRARVAIMSQEVHLFNDTAAENIGYGRIGATMDDIRRAAEIAGAAQFIAALPEGYQSMLGDSGTRLSGGQRQRIALARTILRDPDLLLLDEATNSLDNESERAFQAALARYSQGRTVVVIAHRLSTVEQADQIVVLDEGKLVECGPPATLLSANGAFARLHGLASTSEVAAAA